MQKINQMQKNIIEEFGSAATQEKYARIAEEGLWESEKVLIEEFFKPNSFILDAGCGTGRTTIPLYQIGYRVVGVDITPQMVDAAKKIAGYKNLDIDYQIGDVTNLKFESGIFDNVIFSNNGWTQIPGKKNRQKALDEIFRVLKQGGTFIFTAHKRYFSAASLLFWIKQWIRLYILKPLGFYIEEIDFGDRFFNRIHKGKKLRQKQYIHIGSIREIKEQIKKAGFKIIKIALMGEVSKKDSKQMKAALSAKFDTFKSPVFYVCKKE